MLSDDELWDKCNTNKSISSEDLGINECKDGLTFLPKANLINTLRLLNPVIITKINTFP